MNYLKDSKLFFALMLTLCIGIIILIYTHVSFIFNPLSALVGSIFVPLLIALFLYYTFLPIYQWMSKHLSSDRLVLPLLFLIITGLFVFFVAILIPTLIDQMESFIQMLPPIVNRLIRTLEQATIDLDISTIEVYKHVQQLDISITSIMTNIVDTLSSSLGSILTGTLRFFVVVSTFPLFLVYMFKDGHKITTIIHTMIPSSYQSMARQILKVAHTSASQYIGGRILIIAIVAAGSYISFLLIGLPNALFLGILCGLFDIIPYFGPWLGAFPAIMVALAYSPTMTLLVISIIFVLQMIESYLVTPFVMGNNLELHPVTVVVLVLFAKDFAGILGMILILPLFAILKSIVQVVITHYNDQPHSSHSS